MRTKVQKTFFIVFIVFLISFVFVFHKFFNQLELSSQDWKQVLSLNQRLLSNKKFLVNEDIVILSIDDLTSFELSRHPELNIRRWPLSRTVWAEIIDFLEKASPKVVAVDIPFQNYEDITLTANSSDLIFANTLKKYNNIVFSTALKSPYDAESKAPSTTLIDKFDNPFKPIKKSLDVYVEDKNLDNTITYFSYLPIPDIIVDNVSMSYLNLQKESDSMVRYTQPISRVIAGNKADYMPSLPFAVFLKTIGYDGPINIADSKIRIKNYSIPINSGGDNFINWNGISRSYTFIPLTKIIIGMKTNGKSFMYDKKIYPVEYFKDKIIIIAQTQNNVNTHATAIDDGLTGAEINANIIDNYINDARLDNPLRRKFIQEAPVYLSILIVLAFCVLVALNTLVFKSSLLSLFNSVLLIVLYIIFNVFVFVHPKIRIDLPLIYPLYFMFISLVSSYIYVLFDETSRKREIINIFGKFVSQSVLEKMLKNANNFELKTAKKKITVMFCDVSNFTSISEQYPVELVVERLNQIFTVVTKKIFKYNGTIDKFIGDAVMAYWGDPIANTNDSLSAVKAAVEILEGVDEFNASLEDDDLKLEVKVSVNTGEALVGCIGTDKIVDYTVLGDTVNIAARMGQICSQFNKKIMISESTYKEVNEFIKADYAGNIKLKGKDEHVGLYVPKLGQGDD